VSAVAAVVMARKKKHSAESSLLAKAAALTPPNENRLHEIAEEIVDHLRPWKDRKGNDEITLAVNRELRFLLILAPFEAKRADRTQNRAHAQQLDGALLSVEMLLASAPGPLRDFLLNPLPTMAMDGVWWQTPSTEDIERENRERADSFAAELKRLREVCARAIDPGFGYHPNYDRAKRFCAMFALGLMRDLSDRPITGTKDDTFRAIASLYYEAISGQRDADLKRACDSELRDNRGRELGTD
jgi:hypothetical protein